MKERPIFAVEEDTEEIKRWRSLNQIEIDVCWKNLAERMEEKFQVEESKRGAFKGRGDPLDRRIMRKNKRYQLENGEKTAGRNISLCLESTTCSVCKVSRRS